MQGLLAFREPIVHQGQFFAAVGSAKISMVDVRDIAAVAAEALTGDGHESKIYNLTGPEALTHGEMAEQLSHCLGRDIRFVNATPDQMRGALQSVGFPQWQVGGLIEDYAHYADGEAAEVCPDIETVTGKPAHSFGQFVTDFAPAFS